MLRLRPARTGASWASLRLKTPFDLALEMAAPFQVEQGLNPAPDDIGPALLMRLLAELPNDVPAHFRHLAFQPMGSPETSPLCLPDWGRMEGTGVNAGKMKYSEKQQ